MGRDSSVPAQWQLWQLETPGVVPELCSSRAVQFQLSKGALPAPFSLQARLFSSRRIFHRGFVGYLELRESWA